MLIQDSYTAAKEQVQKAVPEGVYVSCCLFGSPAQASLKPNMWITEIDQVPVKTLSDFLKVVNSDNVSQRQKEKLDAQRLNHTTTISKSQQTDASALLAQPTAEEMEEMLNFKDESHIQVKFVTRDNVTHVRAIRMDKHYWPTWHIIKNENSPEGWELTFMS
jgi:PDZ domain-containing secreted protein